MSHQDKDKLLVRLLSQGCGSIEFAKNMLSEDPEPSPPEPENAGPWCVCGVCRRMPSEEARRTFVVKKERNILRDVQHYLL